MSDLVLSPFTMHQLHWMQSMLGAQMGAHVFSGEVYQAMYSLFDTTESKEGISFHKYVHEYKKIDILQSKCRVDVLLCLVFVWCGGVPWGTTFLPTMPELCPWLNNLCAPSPSLKQQDHLSPQAAFSLPSRVARLSAILPTRADDNWHHICKMRMRR